MPSTAELGDEQIDPPEPTEAELRELPRDPAVAIEHCARRVAGAVLDRPFALAGREGHGDERGAQVVPADRTALARGRRRQLGAVDSGEDEMVTEAVGEVVRVDGGERR